MTLTDITIQEDVCSIIKSVGSWFKHLSGKTILVTGANGFIPSYFVDTVLVLNETLLKKNPAKLIVLTHHDISENSRLSHCLNTPGLEFLVGDVAETSLPDQIDIIVHGASKASPKDYLNKLVETADANVLGTKKLLEYCLQRGVVRFLFISSSEIYGNPDVSPVPETYIGRVDPIGPRAAYEEAKRFAETLCSLYCKARGINVSIARLFHTFGPRLSLADGRVISEFIRRAILEENIEVTNTPSTRTFAYISDSIEAMWRVLLFGKPGQAYNVGSEEEISIENLAKLIVRITGSRSEIKITPNVNIPYSATTPTSATPDIQKIKELGHENKVLLESGLKRLIEWHKKQTP
ncbi:MAG TPA: NAD-dependent epimerase/dehydratase family protein [Candidatus Paceibacterota bacterium]